VHIYRLMLLIFAPARKKDTARWGNGECPLKCFHNRPPIKIEPPPKLKVCLARQRWQLPQRRSGRAHPILRAVLNLPRTIAAVIKSAWGGLRTQHTMSAKSQK
jgi:hypothetical protein